MGSMQKKGGRGEMGSMQKKGECGGMGSEIVMDSRHTK